MLNHFFLKFNSNLAKSKRLANDLDLEEIFKKIDYTKSAIGKQYLYYLIRTPSIENEKVTSREILIEDVSKNNFKKDLTEKLSSFNKSYCYLLPTIIFEDIEFNIKILKYSYISVSLLIISTLLIKLSSVFIIASSILALFNSTLYFINKIRLHEFLNTIRCYHEFTELINFIKHEVQINNIKHEEIKYSSIIRIFNKFVLHRNKDYTFLTSELNAITESIIEIISSVFCLEYFFIELFLSRLILDKNKLLQNYITLGEIDVALSISELRLNQKTCIPRCNDVFDLEKITHPLIDNCVTNSVQFEQNGIVLNGSNMSGKTSFIKTIAANQLLFQTINTCFAEKYLAPLCNIFSLIKIKDDISNNESYFKNELIGLKDIIDKSCKSIVHNLIVIDEPLKGTNIDYSTAIAFGILKKLKSYEKNIVIITTHSFELSELLEKRLNFDRYCFNEVIEENELKYDYQLRKGLITQYNPINLLKANGYPLSVINDAELIYSKKNMS